MSSVGFVDDGTGGEETKTPVGPKKIYLFNHLKFTVLYNEDKSRRAGIRVVGFEVEPYSIAHSHVNEIDWDKVSMACCVVKTRRGVFTAAPYCSLATEYEVSSPA